MRTILIAAILALPVAPAIADIPARLVPDRARATPVTTPDADLPHGTPDWMATGTAIRLPAEGAARGTVLMLPGLGLDTSIYTGTPDGRPGWAQLFAAEGYDVIAWNSPVLDVHEEPGDRPAARRWSEEEIWSRWGIGASFGTAYEDTAFPVAQFENFAASLPEYASAGGGGRTTEVTGKASPADAGSGAEPGGRQRSAAGEAVASDGPGAAPAELANLRTLMDEECPCTVMAHSAAGSLAAALIETDPQLFEALVLLEPVGIPEDPAALGLSPGTLPVVAVYGDRIDARRQTGRKDSVSAFVTAMGDDALMIDLVEEGIRGNTHLFMLDTNAADIADRVLSALPDPGTD